MSIFSNPFFSIAGQKERLANVKNTLVAGFTGQGVSSNLKNPTLNKATAWVGSNPISAILALETIPLIATGTAASLGASAVSKIAASSLKTKVIAGGVGLVAAPIILANPKPIAKAIAESPSKLAKFETNLYKAADKPSVESFKTLVKESPIISAALATAGLFGIGVGAGTGLNLLSNYQNTGAVKKNTDATLKSAGIIPETTKNNESIDYKAILKQQEQAAESSLKLQKQKAEQDLKLFEAQSKSNLELTEKQNEAAIKLAKINQPITPAQPTNLTSNTSAGVISTKKKKKKKSTKKKKKKSTKKKKKKSTKKKKHLNSKKKKKKKKRK
jgi:hypothetical protein